MNVLSEQRNEVMKSLEKGRKWNQVGNVMWKYCLERTGNGWPGRLPSHNKICDKSDTTEVKKTADSALFFVYVTWNLD